MKPTIIPSFGSVAHCVASIFSVTLLFALHSISNAAPITYSFSGFSTGSVSGTAFSDIPFTITLDSTTETVSSYSEPPETRINYIVSTSITLDGIGSGAFTGDLMVFSVLSSDVIGFTHLNSIPFTGRNGYDLLNIDVGSFDLATAFGPVFDPVPLTVDRFRNEPSTLGPITFSSARDVTFTATVVPEPPIALLGATGLLFLAFQRKRTWPNHALQRTAPRVTVAANSSSGALTSANLSP